ELSSDKFKKKVYRENGKGLERNNIEQTEKFGGGKLMVLGCMSANGVGRLVFITGNVNSGRYINILANNCFQSADLMNLDVFIFQQDCASVHTGQAVERWFEKKGV
ncbi:transposable element, partial [Pseudoloma neurophilia]